MHSEASLASASRETLEQAIAQAALEPASPALTAYLSAAHERLSDLLEQGGEFEAALHHYRRFHQLSLQASSAAPLDRAALLCRLGELLGHAERIGAGLCLVGLHIDGPQLNATGRHQLADLLRRQCRPEDVIANQGRDNGLLLALTDIDLASARKVCERVRTAWPLQGSAGSLSLGLSAWRGPADELGRLLERTENALAAARRGGGNCLRSGAA